MHILGRDEGKGKTVKNVVVGSRAFAGNAGNELQGDSIMRIGCDGE